MELIKKATTKSKMKVALIENKDPEPSWKFNQVSTIQFGIKKKLLEKQEWKWL